MARLANLVGALLLGLVALGSASACQVALRAEGEDARCEPNGIRCGEGLTCDNGICRPCVPKPEECNLADDDCDGEIDEDFDQDGDGFKSCGVAGQIDCNDDPAKGGAAIFPGAAELCNGYDDNCDGRTDEAPNNCGGNEVCWTAKARCTANDDCRLFGCTNGGCNIDTGKCTDPDCRVNPTVCKADEKCDEKTRSCVKITAAGDPCDAGSLCAAGTACIDLVQAGISGRAPSICTRACCDSTTCPDGFICRTGTTGTSLCVRASDVGLTTGSGAANAKCVKNEDCRSGVCASGFCVDGCCGSTTCGSGGTCSIRSDNRFLCRAPVGSGQYEASCDAHSDCASGYCYGLSGFFPSCTKKCCTSEDCADGWRCAEFSASGAVVTMCRTLGWGDEQGGRRAGESCTSAGECRSARCTDGICSDFCCRDSDCAGGTVCRPSKLSGGLVANRCVKP